MRKLLMLLFLSFVLLLGASAQNNSTIELKIAKGKESSARIFFYGEILSSRMQTVDLKNDKYVFNVHNNKPSVAVIPIKRGLAKYVYCDRNSAVKINVNEKDIVSFSGDLYKSQYALNEFMPLVETFYASSYSKDFYSTALPSLKKNIKELTINSEKLIAKVDNKYLKDWMQFYLDYIKTSAKVNYYNFYEDASTRKNLLKYIKGITVVEQTVPKSFAKISDVDINSPFMLAVSDDIEMTLSGFFRSKNIAEHKESPKSIILIYKQILESLTNKEVYQAFATQTYLKYSQTNLDWDKYYNEILSKTSNKDYQKALKDKFAKNLEYKRKLDNIKDLPVCNYPLKDLNGKEVKLSDFKGKYVLLDIWTTWCGPCNGELPHLAKKEEQYKNENLVFVSLAFDKKFDVWKRFVLKKKLKGVQLFAGKSGKEVMNHFMARGYPTFILLGKDGKIINKDFPRPSFEEFDKTIKSIIK